MHVMRSTELHNVVNNMLDLLLETGAALDESDSVLGADMQPAAIAGKSIYARLKKYMSEPDEALDPCPELNSIFQDLVHMLQGSPSFPARCGGHLFSLVEQEASKRIDKDELLLSQASAIRALAVRSESRMELFYTNMMLLSDEMACSNVSSIERVREASIPFPYIGNYISMVQTEAKVIKGFLHEHGHGQQNRGGMPQRLRISFCGSGPLPLTGILLAICLDAKVTLIDVDMKAVELSKALVKSWERRGVITSGRVNIVCADAADVRFRRETSEEVVQRGRKTQVRCDVAVVAALIPNGTKEVMARQVASTPTGQAPLLVMRSAHGLTARFAYYQTRRLRLTRHVEFLGLVAPEMHDLGDGSIVDDEVQPLDFFSAEILNSLEVYRQKSSL